MFEGVKPNTVLSLSTKNLSFEKYLWFVLLKNLNKNPSIS